MAEAVDGLRSAKIEELERERNELRHGYDGYRGAFESLTQEFAQVKDERDAYRERADRAGDEAAGLRGNLEGYRNALDKATNEAARLRDDLDRIRDKRRSPTPTSSHGAATHPELAGADRAVGDGFAAADSIPGVVASAVSPLRVICVGTGRDGTTSLAHMMESGFDSRGLGETVMHEWGSVELNAAFCDLRETGDPAHAKRIRDTILDCPHACIVGNGYAAILPMIAEVLGPSVVIVHLRRRDRQACIDSLARNANLYPVNHRYYASVPEATGKRLAAFHFGETSREAWDALSLAEKFGWYYDKTHELIEQHQSLFNHVVPLDMESFGDDAARQSLSEVMGISKPIESVHLNRHVELDDVTLVQRQFMQRVLGKLDVERAARDEAYALNHFIEEYVRHFKQHVSDVDPANAEVLDQLNRKLTAIYDIVDGAAGDLAALLRRLKTPH